MTAAESALLVVGERLVVVGSEVDDHGPVVALERENGAVIAARVTVRADRVSGDAEA